MLATILGASGLGLTACVALGAAALGDGPEKRAVPAAAIAAGSGFAAQTAATHWAGLPLVLIPSDLVALWMLLRLTWKTGRTWPSFAVGAQGLAVAVHLNRLAAPALPLDACLRALGIAHAGVLIALASGVLGARRARKVAPRPQGLELNDSDSFLS